MERRLHTNTSSNPPATPLANYSNVAFDRGSSRVKEVLWIFAQWVILQSPLPGSSFRRIVLRAFGAKIGKSVVIKPGTIIKFPWRLVIGDSSWIGQDVWIDNLADVAIGSNVCISQGAYLCTGSHDWSSSTFDLIVKPITIVDGAWLAAKSTIGPGVTVGEGAVLGLGSVTSKDLEPWSVYSGSPAVFVKKRILNSPKPL